MSNRILFLTGGSGFVGAYLIPALRGTGWTVRALARGEASASRLAALGAEPCLGDLANPDALQAGLRGASHVVHAAALLRPGGTLTEYRQANVAGTARLLQAARTAGVHRFIQIGAAAVVMGDPAPMHDVTEAAPLRFPAFAPYITSKAEAERLVLGADGSGMTTLVLRPPMIWGRGMPLLDMLTTDIRAGRFLWVDHGTQVTSVCHVANLCDAVLRALETEVHGVPLFVADEETTTLLEAFSAMLGARGVTAPGPRRSLPFSLAWRGAWLAETGWRLLRRADDPPITRQVLRLIGKDFTVSTLAARAALGWQPAITRVRGLRAMVP